MQAMIPTNSAADLIWALRCLGLATIAKGGAVAAVQIAEHLRAPDRALRMLKGAVASADFGTSLDARGAMTAFFDTAQRFAAADKLFASGFQKIPLRTKLAITTASAIGDETAEGSYKAISRFILDADAGVARLKVSTILIVTEQNLRDISATGQTFLANQLLLGNAAALDLAVFGDLAGGAVDVVPLTGATFGDNLAALFEALPATKQTSKVFLIITPDVAKAVTGLQGANGPLYPAMSCTGGTIGTTPVLVSEQLVTIGVDGLLLDADGIGGDSEPNTFDAARHASIAMDDAPSDGAQNLTSMWQTNSVALRIERYFGIEQLRPCAAKMTGIL